jgi:hypothetical protein
VQLNARELGPGVVRFPLTRERTRENAQFPLFSDAPHPAVEHLRQMNLSGMTPEQALEALKFLQKQARRS